MKAVVDQQTCIGCGLCVGMCPEVFNTGSDELAEVHGEVTEDNKTLVQETVESCPVAAITLE